MQNTRDLLSQYKLLLLLVLVSLFLRLFIIWYPNAYVFDEVYHGFTAIEYTKLNRSAWDPWASPPKGVAYEWTHPPLAKEIMAASLTIFKTQDHWGWRLPGVFLGTISILLVYLIAQSLFKNLKVSLLSAFFFSLDGINFVQSRTGMNDTYLIFFILATLLLIIRKKLLLSSICFGLAIASKWAGVYFILPVFLTLIHQKSIPKFLYFILIPPIIYLATYIPYFLQSYTLSDFLKLQEQMWIYHTTLKATHDYSSPWWSWPFNLYPVWYYVFYASNGLVGNIFLTGNPTLSFIGFFAIVATAFESYFRKNFNLFLTTICFLVFILPWALSPRIMFLYHYGPSIPFLCLAAAYQIHKLNSPKYKEYFYLCLTLIILGFIFVYPFLVGIPVPKQYLLLLFSTNLAKNPFGGF